MKFTDIQYRLTESEVLLTESSKFTKLRQYVHGLKRQGEGLVIATAMNPNGGEEAAKDYEQMSDAEKRDVHSKNKQLYKDGEDYIKHELKKRYIKQTGVFGMAEKSFIIVDMSLAEAQALGRKWKQTSVIHICLEAGGKKGMSKLAFRMISTAGKSDEDSVVQSMVREFFKAPDDRTDYYSKVGSNKYVIPFFDDEAEWKAVYGPDAKPHTDKKTGKPAFRKKDGSFVLPKAA